MFKVSCIQICSGKDIKKNFGVLIRELRIKNGLGQRELAGIIGVAASYLNDIEKENKKLTSDLTKYESISKNAERIIETYKYSSDVVTNRGFILTSIAFLEKNKTEFSETYILAKELVTNGILVTESAPDRDFEKKWNEEKRMKDGAQTMEALLKGIVNK